MDVRRLTLIGLWEYGRPSGDYTGAAGVRIGMDGRNRWTGDVFIERPWRSPNCKYVD